MKANQADYLVKLMCGVLEVSSSDYYAWFDRELSARATEDADLTIRIRRIHAESDGRRARRAYRSNWPRWITSTSGASGWRV